MDSIYIVVVLTFVGFCTLAYLLLAPVYRFMGREEERSKKWTPDEVANRIREMKAAQNGGASKSPKTDDNPDEDEK